MVEDVGVTAVVALVAPWLHTYVVAPVAARTTEFPEHTMVAFDVAVTVGLSE